MRKLKYLGILIILGFIYFVINKDTSIKTKTSKTTLELETFSEQTPMTTHPSISAIKPIDQQNEINIEDPKEIEEHRIFVERERNYAINELKNKSLVICEFYDLDFDKIPPQSTIFNVCKNQNHIPDESVSSCLTISEVCRSPKTPTEHELLYYLSKTGYMKYLMDTDELQAYIENPENPQTADSNHWLVVQERIDWVYHQIHNN